MSRTSTRLSYNNNNNSRVNTNTRPNTARSNSNSISSFKQNQKNQSNSFVEEGDWLVAILEGRGIGREIGVIAIEKDKGKVIITQYPDTPTYVKSLHLFTTRPPSLILVPTSSLSTSSSSYPKKDKSNTFELNSKHKHQEEEQSEFHEMGIGAKGETSLLVRSLKDAWKDVPIIPVARQYWNEQQGYEFLTQLTIQDNRRTSLLLSVKSKYFALSATCALFKYLESTHSLIFPSRSLRIEYQPLEGTCWIDKDSVEELELVCNITNKNSTHHLLGLLNHCYTPMAARLLRTNILSPLTDTTVIDSRLDVVEELSSSEERFNAIRKSLEPLKNLDLDKLIYQIISSRPRLPSSNSDPSKESEQKISRILLLRTFLTSLPSIRSSLYGSQSNLLETIKEILSDERSSEMLKEINETFNEDAITNLLKNSLTTRNTRIYAIRAEKKLLLDVARETYKEGMSDAFSLGEEMNKKYGWEFNLVSGNNGFVFSIAKEELFPGGEAGGRDVASILGKEFVNINKKGKKIEFSSLELKKRNARIMESVQEIFLMSDDILDELLVRIREGIACLYRSTEAIAMLDMLASFADVANKNNYVRPEWTETLAIKAGRHPLHEHFRLSDGAFVPNDTFANDMSSFQIVGGSNMSGKSTLLRQIALLYIMAQIGCYVPAQYASFRVVDALLTRLGNDDSIEASLSTFSKEMQTMAMILSTMELCNRCLIIVDELGRGTSPTEGIGIAHAIAEKIIKAKALCFFATHFKELSTTLGRYPNVVSLHLETEIDRSQPDFNLTFHHRVKDGNTPLTHYGLELAKLAKLPLDVLEKASNVSNTLESLAEEGRSKARSTRLSIRRKELLRLKCHLKELSTSNEISPQNLLETLRQLQKDGIRMLLSTLEIVEPLTPTDTSIHENVQPTGRREDSRDVMTIDKSPTTSSSPTPIGSHSQRLDDREVVEGMLPTQFKSDSVMEDDDDEEMMVLGVSNNSFDDMEIELKTEGNDEDETLEF